MKAGKSGTYREVGNDFSKNYDDIFKPKEKEDEIDGNSKEKENNTEN